MPGAEQLQPGGAGPPVRGEHGLGLDLVAVRGGAAVAGRPHLDHGRRRARASPEQQAATLVRQRREAVRDDGVAQGGGQADKQLCLWSAAATAGRPREIFSVQ
jgi:hypothetical protein